MQNYLRAGLKSLKTHTLYIGLGPAHYNQPQWFPWAAGLQLQQPEIVHSRGMRESEDRNVISYHCLKTKQPLLGTHILLAQYAWNSLQAAVFLTFRHHTSSFLTLQLFSKSYSWPPQPLPESSSHKEALLKVSIYQYGPQWPAWGSLWDSTCQATFPLVTFCFSKTAYSCPRC